MPILSRTLAFRTDEGSIIHSCRLDMCVFDELELGGIYPKLLKNLMNHLFPLNKSKRIGCLHFRRLRLKQNNGTC